MSLAAQESGQFQLDAGLRLDFGTASYDLESVGSESSYFSQLDFPQPEIWAQVSVEYWEQPSLPDLRWGLSAAAPVLSPQGVFIDQDWWADPDYPQIPRVLFSYTESETSFEGIQASVFGETALVRSDIWTLNLRAGYEFRWSRWTALSVDGWYYGVDAFGELQTYASSYDGEVLTYDLWEHRPSTGLALRVVPNPGWELGLWVDLMGILAWDDDDHLLRTKRSTAFTSGIGGAGGLGSQWTTEQASSTLVFRVNATLSATRSAGEQTQEWYGDADAANGAPEGTKITGVDHVIRTFDVTLAVAMGYLW